jgi:hypothetical protein
MFRKLIFTGFVARQVSRRVEPLEKHGQHVAEGGCRGLLGVRLRGGQAHQQPDSVPGIDDKILEQFSQFFAQNILSFSEVNPSKTTSCNSFTYTFFGESFLENYLCLPRQDNI